MQQDGRHIAEALWKALAAGDWDAAAAYLHDDYVQEWPQSGERIVGRENALAINKSFPGGLPRMSFRRISGEGALVVLETELHYADGSVYRGRKHHRTARPEGRQGDRLLRGAVRGPAVAGTVGGTNVAVPPDPHLARTRAGTRPPPARTGANA